MYLCAKKEEAGKDPDVGEIVLRAKN